MGTIAGDPHAPPHPPLEATPSGRGVGSSPESPRLTHTHPVPIRNVVCPPERGFLRTETACDQGGDRDSPVSGCPCALGIPDPLLDDCHTLLVSFTRGPVRVAQAGGEGALGLRRRPRPRPGHHGAGGRALRALRRAEPSGVGGPGAAGPPGGTVRRLEERGPLAPPRRGWPSDRNRPRRGHRHPRDRRAAPVAPRDDRGAARRRALGPAGARDRGRGRAASRRPRASSSRPPPPCTLKGLKDLGRRARRGRVRPQAENSRYEAVHKSRFFRHWSDPDGGFRGEFKITPDAGARLLSSLEGRANELFDEARKAQNHEAPVAYAADALVDLVTRTDDRGTTRSRTSHSSHASTVMHLRVDAPALRRGHVEDGEVCEIPGVGPVPVATAPGPVSPRRSSRSS